MSSELLRIHRTHAVRGWWGDPVPGFPWTDEPEASRPVIEADGAVAGMIQFTEQPEPRYWNSSPTTHRAPEATQQRR